MQELWKQIPGYENIYEASNFGRIRTAKNKITHSIRHGERHWKQRVLKYKKCADFRKTGYRVTLWKDKKPKDYLVARLVCSAWYGNYLNTEMTVNHKDGNRLNNNINNLEWLTLGDNIRHGFNTGLYSTQKNITLFNEKGEIFKFRSLSMASKFLKRNNGYLSMLIKRHKEYATNGAGERFTFKLN